MLCVLSVLVLLLLLIWAMVKPIINWFRKAPVENSEDQISDDDQVCSLFSSCPCINKNIKSPEYQADKTNKIETLLNEPFEISDTEKKNL